MKRVICLVVLVLALSGIIGFTVYTLNHKGIKKEVENKIVKKIEKITSNMNSKSLTEIYNVYLNKEKHKLKFEYLLINDKDETTFNTSLLIYFDGKTVFDDISHVSKNSNLEEILADDSISQYIKISENNFTIINNDESDYLVIGIGYLFKNSIQKYFIYNINGDMISDEDGILIYDSSLNYVYEDEEINIFYDDEYQKLAKVDNNMIYVLKEKKEKKKLYLEEYKYFIKDDKLKKELLNTYENIKLVDEK